MNQDIAAALIRSYLAAGAALNEATVLIGQLPDQDEQARIRRPIGETMSRIYVELIRPLVREFPDLDPDAEPEASKR